MAWQHFLGGKILLLQAGAREDGFIYLPSDPGHVAYERQDEEEEEEDHNIDLYLTSQCRGT